MTDKDEVLSPAEPTTTEEEAEEIAIARAMAELDDVERGASQS